MPELSGFSGFQTIKILQRLGFSWVRSKGSHAILYKGTSSCVVPLHKELAVGTLRNILRQANISVRDFLNNS